MIMSVNMRDSGEEAQKERVLGFFSIGGSEIGT